MKVVIAIDSFKGSLSSLEAGGAAACGVLRAFPDAEVRISPLADGGEGTLDAIVSATGGKFVKTVVKDPLGRSVTAKYGVIPDGSAIIEMASSSGITLVPPEKRNPLYTTTYGVGELIRHAILTSGCRKFTVGIGGSATNDGGIGMLSALGFKFLDESGESVGLFGKDLEKIARIDTSSAIPELSECEFSVACDVKNPLCGENGCSAIYGPQKGADEVTVRNMDLWLDRYAKLTADTLGNDFKDYPGAGAAGGLGFALLSYLGAKLSSGIELVIERTRLEDSIRSADFVITGEGRLDGQSGMGKAPIGVARTAKKYGKTVLAFAGAVTNDARALNELGIDSFFPILKAPCTLTEAMNVENAKRNLADTAEQAFRIIKALQGDNKNEIHS